MKGASRLMLITEFPTPTNPEKLSEYFRFIEEYPKLPKVPRGENNSTQTHHIIPRCLGGTNEDNNLIELRVKDHLVAHILLSEAYADDPKLSYAAYVMGRNLSDGQYEELRKRHLINLREATIKRNKEYFFMHKGEDEVFVRREDCSEYLELGYVEGMSLAHRKKLGDSRRGLKRSEETKKRLRDSNKHTHIGDIWINNGEKEITISPELLSDYTSIGYTRGRLPFSESHRKNLQKTFTEEHKKNISIAARNRIYKLICKSCGKEFEGKSATTKYCNECKENPHEILHNY